MNNTTIEQRVATLREFFNTHQTFDYSYRLAALKRLEDAILSHEEDIYKALKRDLNKTRFEGHLTEVGIVLGELRHTIKKLSNWMKPKRQKIALSQLPATAKLYSDPYGVVLIMSPWNYPFQLTLIPLIGAIAAGNCAVLKPSAYSAHTTDLIAAIIGEAFDDNYISVVTGGREQNKDLLAQKFDYIFFTGSPIVGKIVMQRAAENLTPVTLELGGKSPCIIDKTADIAKTAKRILFGKLINLGQTCVAPDYLLVHQDVKDQLIGALQQTYQKMISDEHYAKTALPRIINQKHYDRLKGYLTEGNIIWGGQTDDQNRQISFTLIEKMALDGPLMSEEIFGPILPLVVWREADEVVSFVNDRPKPLALYLFTNDNALQEKIVKHTSYGGGCINDTILHITAASQPFGGVGNSGIGVYHGYETFKTFSHQKNILKKWWLFDLPVRYHPYKDIEKKLPQFLFK
ncbi:MAG: aldehyde dehydrogenase family protein [Clostridiales bacterium]|nr:MAG: aldehyde dehydrogenase family protein [Clostridiales bacterium]